MLQNFGSLQELESVLSALIDNHPEPLAFRSRLTQQLNGAFATLQGESSSLDPLANLDGTVERVLNHCNVAIL